MGITPRVVVQLIKVAPLGDPLELTVRGYQLSLRKQEASLIEVEII
jgi:ferrous iron transport protein A